ncbi:MAG: ADP-forming succinate--CoA ligase subunit beta [Legionellales bacterium]|jgi:succinyl-CoA synthetase beta subunit
MNLHEYQAKQLFAEYGMPVPPSIVVNSVEAAKDAAKKLNVPAWVVKAQVHAGGRGKAGGVKVVKTETELAEFVQKLLGTRLVTFQTDAHGQPINQVLIEAPCNIKKELYLSAVLDRSLKRIVIMASTEGGMDIEKVAHDNPEKIHKVVVDPLVGVLPFQGRFLAFALGLKDKQVKQFTDLLMAFGKLFVEKDLSLVEINPLVITSDDDLLCLDGKINIDDNALYRHPDLVAMRDPDQEDPRENEASEWGLSYIALEGNIGCMVNGAGLAMATMDLIKLHGGDPANFLDVGGGATEERVAKAFKLILSDEKVKGVLVNIFGGIVRCDLIANGIINAVKEVHVKVPVVVRLQGTNSELGGQILQDSGLNIIAQSDLTLAAKKIISEVKGE